MARGINKVILIGHLGADPEVRSTQGGNSVTNLSLATSEAWRDRQSGELQERTEWHRIAIFGNQAEAAGQYLRKGSKAYIEGRIQTRKWQDREGNDRWTTEVVANQVLFLDSAGQGRDQTPASQYPSGYPQPRKPQQQPDHQGLEDDIPF